MMDASSLSRIGITALAAGVVLAVCSTGCEFLGFGSPPPPTISEQNNDEQPWEKCETHEKFDEDKEECVDRCDEPEVWDQEDEECKIPVGEDCPDGKMWDPAVEECVDDPDANDPNNNTNDPNNDDPNQQNNGEGPANVEVLFDELVEMNDGYTDPVEFDVPENTNSIAVSVLDGQTNLNYMITDWTAPDGFEIVPAGWENSQGEVCYPDCNLRIMMAPGAFGGLAPNNPDATPGVQPGTHDFTVHAQGMSAFLQQPSPYSTTPDVRVVVHAEVADTPPNTGTLDLNLFFTGAAGWSADTAADDAHLQNVIDEVDRIYDQVGIDIGEIAYHDIDSSYAIIEDMFSGGGDLGQMFSESADAELDGPSVFFVEQLTSPFGGAGGILGISGGIPGPMLVGGSVRSGVAIATDSSQQAGAPGIAPVVAHEIGHYLGLFHTTESAMGGWGDMPSHDPLPDTAQDDPSYLMHATGHGEEMSEWQGRVMRKNPWVYQE